MTRTTWIALSLFAASSMTTSAARPGSTAASAAPTYLCGGQQLTELQIATRHGITLDQLHLLGRLRSLSPEGVCLIPAERLRKELDKAENPAGQDRPDEAVRYRLLDLKDETGFIPSDGLVRARQHVDQMREEEGSRRGAIEPIAGIAPGSWTWLGPGNVGGRLRAIVLHPTTPATMWVGSVGGGIWKTTNSGTSWSPVDDFMANLAVSSMIIDPTDSTVMYAGTGEGFFNIDAIRGAGIFKSTNGGTNWAQLANTANASFNFVNRVAISPDGNTLLAATGSGIFRSINDGTNWTQVHTTRTLDVDFDPTNSTKAIGGRGDGKALWSNDGGVTWNVATTLTTGGRVETAYAPSATSTTYASVENGNGELWKSTDGGQSYTLMNTAAAYLGGQGWYDNVVWVSPTDANFAIVGGIDLWKTVNGGTTLTKISNWQQGGGYGPSAHADHHAITAHPAYNGTSNTTVFFGNDGGIYRATDVTTVGNNPPNYTAGWTELNNNLGITQFYGAAGHPGTGKIVGGTQDNGTPVYTTAGGTEAWADMYGGDGGWCAADPTDANYVYGEYVYLEIHRSTTGGSPFSSNDIISGLADAGTANANFIAPFIMDPNDSSTLLGGGGQLWRTTNAKAATPTWTSIKPTISSPISAIAVATGNSSIVWVGHNNGNVYKTTNGTLATPTWSQVDTNPTALPNRKVTRITVDPANANVVYVTFGGFSADNVYRSADGGSTWADRTGSGGTGLPDIPIRTLVVHPDNSQWLYVGGESGIFTSEDAGATWHVPHDGPANVSVDELFFLNNATRELVAATHGRGVYKQATSGGPVLEVTPTSVAFGSVAVGGSSDRTVTVKNTGTGTLTGGGTAAGTGFSVIGTATYALTNNQTANLTVRFAPAGAGAATGSLTLTGGSGATVPLTGTGTVAGPTLTIVGSTTVNPGAMVQVQVANGPGNAKDWVALHTTAGADTALLDWKYLNGTRTSPVTGVTSATLTFTMPTTPGTYNFRFFQNNTYTKLATSPTVTVSAASTPTLTPSTTTATTGQVIQVTVANGPGNAADWVAMHASAAADTAPLDWKYLNGTRTPPGTGVAGATLSFALPSSPGTYNFRFFQNNTYTKLATSATVTVAAGTTPTLTLSTTTASPGQNIQVTVANGPAGATDWVAMHTTAAADTALLDWKYLNGTRTPPGTGVAGATLTFALPTTPGTYNFRFFKNNTYTKLATSATVTVSAASTPTLTPSTTTATPGQVIQVTVANGPAGATDWVAMHTTAGADSAVLDWKYLNGTRTAPVTGLTGATLTFALPTTPGTYNFRFFQNNTYTKLATSATVTVQ